MLTRSEGSERGATAILVALMAVALFGVGAIAVDMGQAYAQRRDLQTNVDIAVMAAAAKLDGSLADNGYAAARSAAEEYLESNQVFGQAPVDLATGPDDDGWLETGADSNPWKLRLHAPEVTVDYGLGRIFEGADHVDVPAVAAAEVRSPGGGTTMPMYAVQNGCDYGSQIVSDSTSPVPSTFVVPPLTPSTATTNTAQFTISPKETPSGTSMPRPLTLTGTGLDAVTEIGFTNAAGAHFSVDRDGDGNDFTITGSTKIVVDSVPSQVLDADDFWFVRVFKTGQWSNTATAQVFTVGDRLYCSDAVTGAISGNYGSLKIPRSSGPTSSWLPLNIIQGIEADLAIHPSPPADNNCKGDPSPTVESESGPVDGTNCLATDPGFPTEALTDGLVTGTGGLDGRLDQDTTGECGRNGDDRTAATPTGEELNDDMLTCFLTNDTTRISELVTGAEGNVLSADIFKSPRFFWMPVVPVDPSSGASMRYPVVALRAGFVTDQPLYASKRSPYTASMGTYAGVDFDGHNKVRSLRVVFIDEAALPETAAPTGDEIAYTGKGTKILTLVE